MKVTAARRAALEVLRAVRRGELADPALDRAATRVPPRDRGWLQELTYGTLRLRGRLDACLAPRVRRGLDGLDPDVLDLLRLATYQILQMQSVPHYAAVSQTVEQAKHAAGRGAAGLVNGVLHALLRDAAPATGAAETDDPRDVRASHPSWLVERWIRNYGMGAARAIVQHDNLRPDIFLRPLGLTAADAMSRLRDAEIDAEPVTGAPDAIRLVRSADVRRALETIPAVVQDPAATLVTRYADVPDGALVADVCAAPGGKSMALAERAGFVVAADVSAGRLRRVRENAARVAAPIGLLVADARRPALRAVDVVLIDAPCTGTGTLRRHPDGKWRLREDDVGTLAALQREILEAAAPIVRPGGLLVYATCSLEPEENGERVDEFLARHPDFDAAPPERAVDANWLDERGRLLVLAGASGFDGAFAARLRRRAA